MKIEQLIKYELPEWVEYCSIDWVKNIIAWYYSKKVKRKWYRYQKRLAREKYLQSITKQPK